MLRQLFRNIRQEWREVNGTYADHTGIYLGPVMTNVIVRPVVSFLVALLATAAVYVLVVVAGSDALTFGRMILLTVLLTVIFAMNDDEPFTVPVAHGAILMFAGFRIGVYLTEGTYSWIGRRFFVSRYTDPIPGLADLDEMPRAKEGFIYLEEFPVAIWNEATDPNTVLTNVARDSSTVFSNLTVEIQILDPRKWVNNNRPIFVFAERSRASFRTAISFFTGVDCGAVKTILGRMMRGETIVTSFIRKQVGSSPRYSMIQDGGGQHLNRIVPGDEDEQKALNDTIDAFRKDLERADPEMYKQILDQNGHPIIEVRTVEDHLTETIKAIGAVLHRVHIGDFALSKEVEAQANTAAGEAFQFDAQLRSARAIKEARGILTPSEEEMAHPGYEDANMISAAHDNKGIKIIHVTGAGGRDRVTRGLAVGASVHKGDDK